MRSYAPSRGGLTLLRTPNSRQLAGRRRLITVCAVLTLALASGVVGSLTRSPAPGGAHTGPFSYFPSE